MQFARHLRPAVRSGEVKISIRVWQNPHVKIGGRYRMEDGCIVIDALNEISLEDVTPRIARESGFSSVPDLLRTARHGQGVRIFLVRFHFEPDFEDR